ncbi:MAG: DUF1512 domain-containing protein [Acidilobaceae archaeon]
MVEGASSLATWIQTLLQLLWMLFIVMLILGFNQRLQVYLWVRDIRSKMVILDSLASEARNRTLDFLLKNNAKNPETLLNRVQENFVIEPVTIEPTDIIKRLEHLFNIRVRRFKEDFEKALSDVDEVVRGKAEVAAEITAVLNFIHKLVRHYLLLGEKTNNWVLIMQLQLQLSQILQIASTYRRALEDFLEGRPVGDAAGPMTAVRLAGPNAKWIEIERDTTYTEVDFEGRKLFIIKAKGPAPEVGKPGSAVEKIVKSLAEKGRTPSLIITVDAALKLEGEDSGTIADGVGAAIGDPGPEKIKFERVAAEYGIPLRAVIIKMSLEEAVMAVDKKIYEGVEKAVERVKEIIRSESSPGDVVIVAGIGNTGGVV